jgi:hypothetical protein
VFKHMSIWSVPVIAVAAHAGPDIARLAPEDSVAIVSVSNAAKSVERLKETGLWELWESDAVKVLRAEAAEMGTEMLDELLEELGVERDDLALPDGPVGIAFFPVMDDDFMTRPAFLLTADYGSNAEKMNRIVDAAIKKAEDEENVEFDRGEILGRKVLSFDLAEFEDAAGDLGGMPRDPFADFDQLDEFEDVEGAGSAPFEKVHFVRDDDMFLLASHLEPLGAALETIDGEDATGIEDEEGFQGVMRQIGTCDVYAVMLTENLIDLVAEGDPMGMMVEGMVRDIVGDIHGIGLGIKIDTPGAMVEERFSLYMPEGRNGLMALLDTETPRGRIPSFVGPQVVSYGSINFEFDGLIDLIRQIGQTNPMTQQQIDMFLAEHGEEIELVTSALGPDMHSISTVSKPIRVDSVKSVTAIRCRQPTEVEQVLVKYAGGFLEARDFLGHRIYSVPMNMMAMAAGPAMGPQADGFSIGFGAGYAFAGTTSMVEDCLRSSGRDDMPGFADNPAFKRALRALPPGDSVAWGDTDIVEYLEYIKVIDLLMQEQMIEQMEMWNPEYADEMRREMEAQPPPPWRDFDIDIVRRYVGPTAWDMRVDDDGFICTMSVMPAEE